MPARNFTNSEEAEIVKLYTVGKFGIKQIKRAYGYKYHISFSAALKRQGVTIRSNHEANRIYKINPYVFDKIDNEQAAYFLGFIYADGCVHKRSLSVAIKREDVKIIQRLKSFLQSEHPIKNTSCGATKTDKRYNQVTFIVTHKHLAKRLKQLGINKDRPNINDCLSQVPSRLLNHWLRGLFDGDGSWHKAIGMNICGQKDAMESCRKILIKYANTSPVPQVYKHQIANIWYINYGGRVQCLRIADWIYKDATIYLKRKYTIPYNWRNPNKKEATF